MGGGGQSKTTTQIPESLKKLWESTTNQITPLQGQMWAPSVKDASGTELSAQEVGAKRARLQELKDLSAGRKVYDEETRKYIWEPGIALTGEDKAEYDALTAETGGWTQGPNEFTQQQGYEKFYGKPGEGGNYTPATANAALDLALGSGEQTGFTQESKWTNPAAAAAMNLASAPTVGSEFTQERPAGVAGWSPHDLRLMNYITAGDAQFMNPQNIGNPDPYAPQQSYSQMMSPEAMAAAQAADAQKSEQAQWNNQYGDTMNMLSKYGMPTDRASVEQFSNTMKARQSSGVFDQQATTKQQTPTGTKLGVPGNVPEGMSSIGMYDQNLAFRQGQQASPGGFLSPAQEAAANTALTPEQISRANAGRSAGIGQQTLPPGTKPLGVQGQQWDGSGGALGPQQVTTKQQTPAGTASQTVKYNQPQQTPPQQNGGWTAPATSNAQAVQSTGNAAGWMDVTKPAYEQGYVSQANQLQNIGANTPNLEKMANSPMVTNAMGIWANSALPTLQNQAAMMGLGRSGALVKNIANSQQQMLLPLLQQQAGYENEAIGRAQQGASQNVSALQAAAQAQQGREAQDYGRNLQAANMMRAQQQATLDAQQQDFLRRQQLSQQGSAQQAQNLAQAGGMFQNLAQQDTARQMGGAQQLVGMAQTERDWGNQAGDFAYQEFLRAQGLGENMLFQPLGGAGSAIGTTTSGGK